MNLTFSGKVFSSKVFFARVFALCLLLAGCGQQALADGRVVDKVYHPYVQPYEQEFEYRYVYQKQN